MTQFTLRSLTKIALNALLIFSSMAPSLVEGKQRQEITQPIGGLVRIWDTTGSPPLPLQPPSRIPPFSVPQTPVQEVNYICAQWDFNDTPHTISFDERFPVTEIILTKPQHFVRLDSPATGSGPNGPWMMRSEYVRGLTPQEIKERFALPTLPTNIVSIDLPASPDPATGKDYALWTGIAAPIEQFGQGGGVQNRIIADFDGTHYFPQYEYVIGSRTHQQLIGKFALSYRPMAGSGNTQHIAAYLDRFVPEAYSDLEDVYTLLDFLNFVDFGPGPLRHALDQINPQQYLAVPFVITRNAMLFGNAVLDHCRLIRAYHNSCGRDSTCNLGCASNEGCFLVNVHAIGEYLDERRERHSIGFNDRAGALLGTFDYQPCQEWTAGMSLAGIDNYLKWDESRGNAHIASVKWGLYGSYAPIDPCACGQFYLDGLITAGYNWTKAHRLIKFPGVDREADNRHTCCDIACHLQGGLDLPCYGWQLSPLVKVSYFYVHENAFSEHGAESLNLKVKTYHPQTLRSSLGVGAARVFPIGCMQITPQIYAGWVRDQFFDNRTIEAHFKDLGSSFKVHSGDHDRDGFLGSVCVQVQFANGFSAVGSYDLEVDQHFTSQRGKLGVNWCF